MSSLSTPASAATATIPPPALNQAERARRALTLALTDAALVRTLAASRGCPPPQLRGPEWDELLSYLCFLGERLQEAGTLAALAEEAPTVSADVLPPVSGHLHTVLGLCTHPASGLSPALAATLVAGVVEAAVDSACRGFLASQALATHAALMALLGAAVDCALAVHFFLARVKAAALAHCGVAPSVLFPPVTHPRA